MRADPEVAFVVPDGPVKAYGSVQLAAGDSVPTGIRRIGAATPTAVRTAADGAVAIIDTGIDLTTPELNVEAGKDCTGSGSADDDNGHGTHVAGIVAARNNGSGLVGVAPNTRVIAVKVLDEMGEGMRSQVICGIDWVTANAPTRDIEVANLSLGGPDYSGVGTCETDPLRGAICRSTAAGVTYAVSAGNEGRDFAEFPPDVPATYPEVLTVTAFADTDGRAGGQGPPSCDSGQVDDRAASFSNHATADVEAAHTIAAPGVCVSSLMTRGGTALMSGTSTASPHVAAAVALCGGSGGVRGPCAELAPTQIIERMRADAAAPGDVFGFGGDPFAPLAGDGGRQPFYGNALRIVGKMPPPDGSGEAGPPAMGRPPATAPTSTTQVLTPRAGDRSASPACRTSRNHLSSMKRRLRAATRAAARRPTGAGRKRVRRTSVKLTQASRRVARRCRSSAT